MRILLKVLGGLAVVFVFFVGTLLTLQFYDPKWRDEARISNIKSVMEALERYRASTGAYPVIPPKLDAPLSELAGRLADVGFTSSLPSNLPGAPPSRYFSADGKSYGLWLRLERTGDCRIEVNAANTGWWGQQPPCRL